MKRIKALSLFYIFAFIIPHFVFSQVSDVEMADTMRSNGKIYVVVAVVSIVLAGLLIYLILIDRKVRRLEQKSDKRS